MRIIAKCKECGALLAHYWRFVGTLVAHWWRIGGALVAHWWRIGGALVAHWWRIGGALVAHSWYITSLLDRNVIITASTLNKQENGDKSDNRHHTTYKYKTCKNITAKSYLNIVFFFLPKACC